MRQSDGGGLRVAFRRTASLWGGGALALLALILLLLRINDVLSSWVGATEQVNALSSERDLTNLVEKSQRERRLATKEVEERETFSNSEVVEMLKASEASRVLSRKEVREGAKVKIYLEIAAPSASELARLRAAAYSVKGTVGENTGAFGDTSLDDQLMSDYLVSKFFLNQGSGSRNITISMSDKEVDHASYSASVKLSGTGRTEVTGGRIFIGPGWRFEKLVEAGSAEE